MIPSIEQKLSLLEVLLKDLNIPYIFILQDTDASISYTAYTPPNTNAVMTDIFKNLLKKDAVLGEVITNYEAVYTDAIEWDYKSLSEIPQFVAWENSHTDNCASCKELLVHLKKGNKIQINKNKEVVAELFAKKMDEKFTENSERKETNDDSEFDFGSITSF